LFFLPNPLLLTLLLREGPAMLALILLQCEHAISRIAAFTVSPEATA